jgi:hypothetical protein
MKFNEFTDSLGRFDIEAVRKCRIVLLGAGEIIELALAGEANPLTGRDLTGEHLTNVLISRSDVRSGVRLLRNPNRGSGVL